MDRFTDRFAWGFDRFRTVLRQMSSDRYRYRFVSRKHPTDRYRYRSVKQNGRKPWEGGTEKT